eukprot:scaffold16189_cov125-Cylindrotheca_fusiformis.AAC.4
MSSMNTQMVRGPPARSCNIIVPYSNTSSANIIFQYLLLDFDDHTLRAVELYCCRIEIPGRNEIFVSAGTVYQSCEEAFLLCHQIVSVVVWYSSESRYSTRAVRTSCCLDPLSNIFIQSANATADSEIG